MTERNLARKSSVTHMSTKAMRSGGGVAPGARPNARALAVLNRRITLAKMMISCSCATPPSKYHSVYIVSASGDKGLIRLRLSVMARLGLWRLCVVQRDWKTVRGECTGVSVCVVSVDGSSPRVVDILLDVTTGTRPKKGAGPERKRRIQG